MKSKTYEEFVEKFKPKKTTDDCMTPPLIYEAVKDWACKEYGIDPDSIVRPFWPGGDYEHYNYPDGCVVLDNPPFSISSKIYQFYLDRGIPFFLFAPSLTSMNSVNFHRLNHIYCNADIIYDNGAVVRTAFVTSFGGDVVAQSAPDLCKALLAANEELKASKKALPKYTYPDHVITAPMLQRYAKYGIEFKVHRCECMRISGLDAQKPYGKSIYGGGILISDAKAAERAAAIQWSLSEREKTIIDGLG